MDKKERELGIIFFFSLIIITFLGAFLRFYHLSSDELFDIPYALGTSADDEGWQHSARIWALYGRLIAGDSWSTFVITPLSNAVTYLSFLLFGINYTALRFPIALSGVLTI